MQLNGTTPRIVLLIAVLVLIGTVRPTQAHPTEVQSHASVQSTVGTAFSYQGKLQNAGGPISGLCDFRFSMWDAPAIGARVGVTQTRTSVSLTDGLFTIPDLDFGAGAFNGDPRWLQVAVKCPGDADFTTMDQRHALTPVPYAQFAETIYRRTVVVSPIGTAIDNGAALLDAVAGIADASATYPYLIHIEPGVYDLITETLQMQSFVDIEGSGEGVTTVTAMGNAAPFGGSLWPRSTMSGADDAELRFVTVENTGGDADAVAFYNGSTSPRLTHVTLIAVNGASKTLGVFNNGGACIMTDVTISVTGPSTVQGAFIFRGASSVLTNVAITASGGSGEGININFSSPTIRNSVITASGVGITVNDALDTGPWDVVTIDTSQIRSQGSTLASTMAWPGMTTVRIGASQLAGGDIAKVSGSNITFVCAGVYDEAYVMSAGCP